MLFSTTIAQYDAQIGSIKAQIEELRRILSQTEHERQNLLSVGQMWQSAISQLQAAKVATESIGQSQLLAEAEAAVISVFRNVQYLPEEEQQETPTESTPEPAPETPTETIAENAETQPATIDVAAEAMPPDAPENQTLNLNPSTTGDSQQEVATQQALNGNNNGNNGSHHYLSYEQLIQLDRQVLLRLIEAKGIEVRGTKTTKRLATLLSNKVNETDLIN